MVYVTHSTIVEGHGGGGGGRGRGGFGWTGYYGGGGYDLYYPYKYLYPPGYYY